MKKLIPFQFVLLITLACSFIWPIHPAEPQVTTIPPTDVPSQTVTPSPTAIPSPTATLFVPSPPPASVVYLVYENQAYGFTFSRPDYWPIRVISEEHIEVGDKIVVSVFTQDPTQMPGDRPIFENSEQVQLGFYSARLLTGYIGAIGGYIPQQFRMYMYEYNGYYICFTLYALGLNVTEGDMSQIIPLAPEDVAIFETIMLSVAFK